jgi:hypothetical protein
MGNLTSPVRAKILGKCGLNEKSPVVRAVRTFNTFLLVSFAWIFFRANSLADAFSLVGKLFTSWSTPLSSVFSAMGISLAGALTSLLSILTLIMLERLLTYDDSPDGSGVITKNGAFIYFVWIIAFAWALLLSKDMMSTFIYFQF